METAASTPLSEDKFHPSVSKPLLIEGPALQISQEHCYSKLGPFRSNSAAGFFPTEVLFPSLLREKTKRQTDIDEPRSQKEEERKEDQTDPPKPKIQEKVTEEEEEEEVDVVGVDPPVSLPYDETRVSVIMMECVKHLNLVKVPPENSDLLLEKVLLECGYQQRRLLSTLLRILQGDHLARLSCKQVFWYSAGLFPWVPTNQYAHL